MTQLNKGTRRGLSVSQTTLNLLRDCPRCFWFYLKLGLQRPRGPWPSVHTQLDRIINGYWDRYAAEGELPPLVQGRLTGVPVFPRVEAWYDNSTGLYVAGRLDACLRVNGNEHVPVDHKSRGSQPNGTHEAYQLQLDVYHLLLEQSGYPPAGYGLLIYYIPENGDLDAGLVIATDVQKEQTDPERALAWVRKAREVLGMNEPPLPSPACEFCRWARETGRAD